MALCRSVAVHVVAFSFVISSQVGSGGGPQALAAPASTVAALPAPAPATPPVIAAPAALPAPTEKVVDLDEQRRGEKRRKAADAAMKRKHGEAEEATPPKATTMNQILQVFKKQYKDAVGAATSTLHSIKADKKWGWANNAAMKDPLENALKVCQKMGDFGHDVLSLDQKQMRDTYTDHQTQVNDSRL